MERDTFLYKARRKLQVIANTILPDEIMSKIYSYIILKKKVNLKHPKTFNEKIQWLKLYDYPNNDLVIKCADKYKVRDYIKSKGLENLLVPLIGEWENVDDIEWEKLPNQFVIKCNHGCAYNLICYDKKVFDIIYAKRKLKEWIKEDFGKFNIERHYSKIKPHIICEKFLGEKMTDFKFFCFNGIPKYIYISSDLVHDRQAKISFYQINGKKMDMQRNDYEPYEFGKFPNYYEEMLDAAKILCKDFKFVRVDFMITKDRFYFSELTFTPSGGMMPFEPQKYDLEWGGI